MPERQEDLDETVTGPPVSAAFNAAGEPTPAALGFAKKQGVPFEALERVKTDKGEYLAAKKHMRGKSTVDALPELLGSLLRDLAFPKQMHWDAMLEDGKGELVFGRPIRWLLYLYGGRVVPFTIGRTPNAAGTQVQEVTTGAVTYGHRFLATSGRAGRSIKVRTFDEYPRPAAGALRHPRSLRAPRSHRARAGSQGAQAGRPRAPARAGRAASTRSPTWSSSPASSPASSSAGSWSCRTKC